MSRIPFFHQVASQAPDAPTPPPSGGAYADGYFTLPDNSTPENRRDKMPDFTHAGYMGWSRKGQVMNFQELQATGLTTVPVTGVNVEDFESARDQAAALGGAIVYVPPGVYTLTRNVISMNTSSRNYNNIHWFGDPDQPPRITVETVTRNLGGAFEFTVDTALINGTQLTVTGITPRGSDVFQVASTTGFQVGQYLKSLLDQEPPYWTDKFYAGLGESDPDANGWYRGVHRIVALGPNWIKVDKPLRETFDPAQGYELKRYQPMRNVSIQNFIFDWAGKTTTGSFGGSMRVLRFDWCWDCFAANIYADSPPTSFYHFTDTAHFTGFGTGGRNAKNQTGGGNGYGASLAFVHDSTLIGWGSGPKGTAFPSDPTWPDWLTWRHAPNFQNNAQGNVIRDMRVEGSDFHWHAQFPRQNLLHNVELRKGPNRVGPWLVNSAWIFNIDSGALTPAGNGNVVWGCSFDAFGDDRNGLKFGGLEENWWFCYNEVKLKISNVEQQASILMFGGYQHGFFRLIGNTFYIEDGAVDFVAMAFAPGLVQGQGQSANGIWPPFTPQYGGSGAGGLAAVTPLRDGVIQAEDNTFVNVPEAKRYSYGFGPSTGGGEAGPLASQLDADNTWTTGSAPARPVPPIDLLQWQWDFRSANGILWES